MFIAADGLNYERANSYITVAYADDYFADRGNISWTGTTQQKESALIKATDYIEQTYGQRFIGIVGNFPQLLSWPRYNTVYDYDVIPENLKKATCELAVEALTTPLNPAITRERSIKREKVDVIEIEYSDTGTQPTLRPAVIGLLSPLISGSSINRRVVRV